MQSGSQPKELVKFLAGLQRQRIIKRCGRQLLPQ